MNCVFNDLRINSTLADAGAIYLKMVVHIHIFFQKIGFQRLSVKKVGFI
jgi:hypothetical protein